jgi:DNA helicase HerA-like ATPase
MLRKRLGVVTDGAFKGGLTVRLDPDVSTEALRIGDFCIVEGEQNLYFSMVSDMQLRATDPRLPADPPAGASSFVARALRGSLVYATVQVKPMQMMPKGGEDDLIVDLEGPQPVRTIPMHLATLAEATESDFRTVFGDPRMGKQYFAMGTPLTMDIPVCINLERLVERSNGIFGQSGTGKSFLVRLLLCGVIHSGIAVNLIFDMHDEYAFGKESEDGVFVRGLSHIFGRSKVLVYSLDRAAASRGGGRGVDRTVQIGLNQIEPEDVMLLADELDLPSTAVATIGLLGDKHGAGWLEQLLAMSPPELELFADESGAHPASLAALQRRLKRLQRKEYVVERGDFNLIDEMVQTLDRGKNVILHFGRHDSPLDHMLVANLITRRVRHLYRDKVERYEETQNPADRPRPLMITIEEAHSFLSPSVSRQTIFGTIARELRKYHVTLMVVDQRPNSIDSEVLSQLGTRVTGKLTEERDIEAVLTGVGNRSFLRGALESLDTREQVLLMGHAVPMPVVVRTRKYDDAFYAAMSVGDDRPQDANEAVRDLFDF